MERFQTILEISSSTSGPIKSADEIENLLVEEMRRLGNTTMGTWAAGAEERLVKQFKAAHPSARARKKTLKWWGVFGVVIVTERIWKTDQKSYVRLLGAAIGVTPKGRSARLKRVLTDFGCEHSFQHAAARVKEHYGFKIGFSAVRDTTLEEALRARQILEREYKEPYRARDC